jgi:hypothetical protein
MAARDREESAPNDAPALETLELPTRPLWDAGASSAPAVGGFGPAHATAHAPAQAAAPTLSPMAPLAPVAAAQPAPKVTLASAFTALLAAEQSAQPAAAAPPAITEASVEDAVRRVLVRMTDDLVRRIVLDTAERLIREEIERIKANPD